MEDLETREKVINLGKKLAKHFEGFENGDAISQWMSHYLSEQIVKTESSKGKAKTLAEQNCFEAILKLWHHQSYYPRGNRPFENFEPVFRAIESLDPEKKFPHYYIGTDSETPSLSRETEAWVKLAKEMDISARILIQFSFEQAMRSSINQDSIDWINTMLGVVNSDETDAVIRFIPELVIEDEEIAIQKERDKKIETLEYRLEQLESFIGFSEILKKELLSQIDSLKNN
jgi:hypothetical protein